MRRATSHDERVAEVTRRRLEALALELGVDPPAATHEPVEAPLPGAVPDGPGRHARRPLQPEDRARGWLSDRVPAALRGRVGLGSAQFGVVAVAAATALVLTAWWVVRSGGPADVTEIARPREVVPTVEPSEPPSEPLTGPAGPGSPSPPSGAESPPAAEVVVDVAGRVRRPGIAVLPSGSRVADALRAAGGARRGVDLSTLNLARQLTDGEQILVGQEAVAAAAPPLGSPTPGATAPLVNLNTADQTALESLPGVGPVTASAILQWRAEHGAFTAVEELLEISGIGDATLAELAPHVTL